jgi:hypothetical protein
MRSLDAEHAEQPRSAPSFRARIQWVLDQEATITPDYAEPLDAFAEGDDDRPTLSVGCEVRRTRDALRDLLAYDSNDHTGR